MATTRNNPSELVPGDRFASPHLNEPLAEVVCPYGECEHVRKPHPDTVHVREVDGDAEWHLGLGPLPVVVLDGDDAPADDDPARFANAAHAQLHRAIRGKGKVSTTPTRPE
jgi:hypothetical protein